MALNGGDGLVYLGETLIAGETRPPYMSTLGTITNTKTVAAAAHAQDPASPVQVVASTAEDYHWLWVGLNAATGGNALNGSCLLEVWFGGSGSEVLQATFQIGYRNGSATIVHPVVSCPFYIPAGTRVSYTTRSGRTGQSISLKTNFGLCDSPIRDQPVTSSIDTSASRGIVPDNSTSANTWGAWTEIFASTSVDMQGFHVTIGLNNQSTVGTAFVGRIELGIGASSSEVSMDKEFRFDVVNTEVIFFNPEGYFYINKVVPAGSRIVARWQHSIATANDIDVVVSGIPL
jgi:hypothetical protein